MITAVSNLRTNNFGAKSKCANGVNSEFADKLTNSKQATSIYFTGNQLNLIKVENKLTGRASRFAEETTGALGKLLRNLRRKTDLPFVNEPVIAANKGLPTSIVFGPDGMPIPDLWEGGVLHEMSGNAVNALGHATGSALDAKFAGFDIVDALTAKADILDSITSATESKGLLVSFIDSATDLF